MRKSYLFILFAFIVNTINAQQVIIEDDTPSTLVTNPTFNYKVATSYLSFPDNGGDPIYGIDYVIDEVVVDISGNSQSTSEYKIILTSPESTDIILDNFATNEPTVFDNVRYVNRKCPDDGSRLPESCIATDCFDNYFDNESLLGPNSNDQWKLEVRDYVGVNNTSSTLEKFKIVFKFPTNCEKPFYDFTNLTINANSTSADVSFASNLPSGQEAYEFVLMESNSPGFTDIDFSSAAKIGQPSTSTFTMNNLQPNTRYDFYIKSVCSLNSVSNFTCGRSFITKCASFSHFSTSFEGFHPFNCWRQLDEFGNLDKPEVNIFTGFDPNTGTKALRFTNDNQDYFITPELNNLSDGNNRLRFYSKVDFDNGGANVPGDSELIVGSMSDRSDESTFQPKDTIQPTNLYKRYTVNFESPSSDNYVAIKAFYPSSDIAIDVDDITWEEIPNCVAPTNLQATQQTNGDQLITWQASTSTVNGYEYVVMANETDPDMSNAIQSGTLGSNQTNVTISGLQNETDYDIYIRTICIGEKSPWSNQLDTQSCLPQGYFSENFDSYSNLEFPDCWSEITNTFIKYDRPLVASNPNSGSSHFQFSSGLDSSYTSYFITPSLTATPENNGLFEFYAKGDSNTNLEIGLMSDPKDESTFNSIENINITSSYQQFSKQLSVGQKPYIAFKVTISAQFENVFIDDISWSAAICSIPANVELFNFTTSSLEFSWDSVSSASNGYEYVLMNDGDTPDTSNAVETGMINSGTTNLSITGLPNITQYDFYVRSDCATDGKSSWSSKVDAKTRPTNDKPCNAIELSIGTTSSGTAYNNNGATSDPNEPEMNLNTGASKSVWFKFTAPQYGNVRLSTDIADATLTNTELAVYRVGDCSDYNTFEQVGFDQDSGSTIFFNSVLDVYRLTSGETYYVQIDPYVGSEGIFGMALLDNSYVYNGNSWTPSNPIGSFNNNAALIIENGDVNINSNTNAGIIDVYPTASLKIDAFVSIGRSIKFLSNSNGTGQFDEYNQITSTKAIVERYIPAASQNTRAFRFLTTAVDSDEPIYDNWQESGKSPSGYGTHITGSTTGANGFDVSQLGNPSMYAFDNSFTGNQSNAWNAIANTDTKQLFSGEPYRVFIRGDRNYNLNSFPANPPNSDVTLRSEGDLRTGSATNDSLSIKQNYYNLVGNPYQASVNINEVNTTNVNTNSYWIWDPNLSTNGAYAAVNLPAGTTPSSSDVNQFIQPGQAFFVQTLNDGAASITFDQVDKAVKELPTDVFSTDDDYSLNMKLYQQEQFSNDQPEADALSIHFSADHDNTVTPKDAQKLGNPDENLARLENSSYLSIENRALPADQDTLGLFTTGYQSDQYVFEFELDQLPNNTKAYLVDHYEDEQILINNGYNTINFSVDQNSPQSIATDRFSIDFEVETFSVDDNELADSFTVYPNPVTDSQLTIISSQMAGDEVELNLYDMIGQNLLQTEGTFDSNGELKLNLGSYQAGVYFIEVSSNGQTVKERLIIK